MWSPGLRAPEVERLIHQACDLGITSFDTAPLYDFHRSEEILGNALRGRRDRVQVLTKAGLRWDDVHGRVLFEFTDTAGVRRSVRKDSRPQSIRAEVEASLRRLQVEQIDLLQIHHPDLDTPIADTLGELSRLRDAGVIKAIGVSNYDAQQLTQASDALGAHGLDALQCEYSLVQRWPEHELLPLCLSRHVGVLAYSPLAKGTLAGLSRRRNRRLSKASRGSEYGTLLSRATIFVSVATALMPVARAHGVTVDQIALAWLLAQPGLSAVVAGASTAAQLRSNAAAASVSLSPEELRRIGEVFSLLATPLQLQRRLRRR